MWTQNMEITIKHRYCTKKGNKYFIFHILCGSHINQNLSLPKCHSLKCTVFILLGDITYDWDQLYLKEVQVCVCWTLYKKQNKKTKNLSAPITDVDFESWPLNPKMTEVIFCSGLLKPDQFKIVFTSRGQQDPRAPSTILWWI